MTMVPCCIAQPITTSSTSPGAMRAVETITASVLMLASPSGRRFELRKPQHVERGIAELDVDGRNPLEVMADIQFIRHAHAAMELHRLVGDKLAGIADLRLDARGKPRKGRVFAGKVEFHRNALPLLSEGTNLLLEGPGV